MPVERVQGLDFAFTAVFVVLSIDAYRARPDRLSAACAMMCAGVAAVTVPEQMLVWAWPSAR
jgi:predicted branched-subunit amino acid permease